MKDSNLKKFLVSQDIIIRDAIRVIDRNARGIALVVDAKRRLLVTLTDGDIRRAMLAGLSLDASIQTLMANKVNKRYPRPVTCPLGTSPSKLLEMMNQKTLRHIPLLDPKKRVVDIVFLTDLLKEYELPLNAVVMAGGYGKRLRPLTNRVPKPMLSVGGKPLLERIIEGLKRSGIHQVNLSTHYKGKQIERYFGNGKSFGMGIQYVQEDRPLGTAGVLRKLDFQMPLLVINGDILTSVDFRAMLDFHRDNQAEMTVGVRHYEIKVPYGVVECRGSRVTKLSEKPVIQNFINAGIYLLNPRICREIPRDRRYDMPELIQRLLKKGHRVVSFPIREYWLDIGQISDYERAKNDVVNKKVR